jgi:hypothetical protein
MNKKAGWIDQGCIDAAAKTGWIGGETENADNGAEE